MVPVTSMFWITRDYYVTACFDTDGKVKGHTGCNSYGASYNLSGNSGIIIGPDLVTTLVYCTGPVGQQEGFYLTLLLKASSYELTTDGLLNLKDADGTVILVYYERENATDSAGVPAPHVVR